MSKGLNPILMIAVLVVGFIGALAVSYFIMPQVAPEYTELPEEPITAELPEQREFEKYNYLDYGPGIVQGLERKVDSLANIVEFRRESRLRFINEITRLTARVDSLDRINAAKDEVIFRLETRADSIGSAAMDQLLAERNTKISQQVQDIATTIGKLEAEELGPILNLLNDEELVQLYLATPENRRNKIVAGLNKEKAAILIRNVIKDR